MKVKTVSKLRKQADKVFSLWVRARDRKCFTCGSRDNLQNGHFISRSYNILRFSEINCNAQCVVCNVFKSGNMPEYAERLMKKYGPEIISQLNKEKRQTKQWKVKELEEIIKKYS